VLSQLMEEGLTETFNQKGQAVVLLNRRGFAPCLFCPGCKNRVRCPNCGINLVAHAPSHQLECHYCRFRQEIIAVCPQVGCGHRLSLVGLGTQRVEDTLKKRFPQIRLQRVDSDTMRHRGEYERVVSAFSAREIDCLVGTQMIAKGLDFPFVSFVGVVDADPGALSSDFRAEERLFQLITQVAGRAGRAAMPGRVIVQTTQPDLPSLGFALRHDYESFATRELALRERVGWPPYRRLARMVFAHARDETAGKEAARVAEFAKEGIRTLGLAGADVIGPNPCPLHRLRRQYRQDLLLRTGGAGDLHRLLQYLEAAGVLRGRVATQVVDVDPVNLQ
jgi:primosomal protein N' (replication factor Y)